MQFKLLMGVALSAVLLCLVPATQVTAAAEPYSVASLIPRCLQRGL